jgi:hypothetical protein
MARYWVGNTGNWSDTAHWSASSGGASGASVPDSTQDVFFDANSITSGSRTVTVDANASCLSMNWTGVLNTPTFAGSAARTLTIYGSLTFVSGMNVTYAGMVVFASVATGRTITTAGKSFPNNSGASFITFSGVGGAWTLQDNWTMPNSSTLSVTNGTLNMNGKTVSCGSLSSTGTGIRSITMGAAALNLNTNSITFESGLTFDCGTSTITFLAASQQAVLSCPSTTFYDVTYSPSLTTNPNTFSIGTSGQVGKTFTFHNLTYVGDARLFNGLLIYSGNTVVVTGTLTVTGNSAINRIIVYGTPEGTSSTITAAAVSLTNVDFTDMTGGGAATWSGTSIGNLGGNTGITFTTPVTRYWVGNGGNWSDTAHWSTSSGGASGASIPLAHDSVIFDVNSITTTGQTITVNTYNACKSITTTGVLNSPTMALSSASPNTRVAFFGNVSLIPGLTYTGAIEMRNRDTSSFNITGTLSDVRLSAYGGTVNLSNDLTLTGDLYINYGTFDAQDYDVQAASLLSPGSGTSIIYLGNGTWTLTATGGDGYIVRIGNNTTVYGEGSTIDITGGDSSEKWFVGGGETFYNLNIDDTNVFIYDGNTFHNLSITAGNTVYFEELMTQTVYDFIATGTVGNEIILLSDVSSSQWYLYKSSGDVQCDYLDISDSNVYGGAMWFAGVNSTDTSNNDGWFFGNYWRKVDDNDENGWVNVTEEAG